MSHQSSKYPLMANYTDEPVHLPDFAQQGCMLGSCNMLICLCFGAGCLGLQQHCLHAAHHPVRYVVIPCTNSGPKMYIQQNSMTESVKVNQRKSKRRSLESKDEAKCIDTTERLIGRSETEEIKVCKHATGPEFVDYANRQLTDSCQTICCRFS